MIKKKRILSSFTHIQHLKVYQGSALYLCAYNSNYFLGEKTRCEQNPISHFDLTTQSTTIATRVDSAKLQSVDKNLQQFIYKGSLFYYRKLRFIGKGYKIKKTKIKKSFKFYFGHSHVQYIFTGGLSFKKLSKYRLFLVSNNKKKINRIVTLVLSTRVLSRYTKRGIRSTRYFILKRPGKKSTY